MLCDASSTTLNATRPGAEIVCSAGETPVLLMITVATTGGDDDDGPHSPHAVISKPATHQPMSDELIHGGIGREAITNTLHALDTSTSPPHPQAPAH